VAAAATAAGAPALRESCVTPVERAVAVSFGAADGTRLAGVVLGSGPVGIVLVHGVPSDLCEWLPEARTLAARSYRVLALDLRNFGSSGRPPLALAGRYERDVAAAARELLRRGARRVVLVGSSYGGSVVLRAAPLTPALAGIVSLSGGGGGDVAAALRSTGVPLLLVAARADARGAADLARRAARAARRATATLLLVPGGFHGTSLLEVPRVARAFDAFLRRVAPL
jgi:pimeloyl-ACP methyl ester carboxylesterase